MFNIFRERTTRANDRAYWLIGNTRKPVIITAYNEAATYAYVLEADHNFNPIQRTPVRLPIDVLSIFVP